MTEAEQLDQIRRLSANWGHYSDERGLVYATARHSGPNRKPIPPENIEVRTGNRAPVPIAGGRAPHDFRGTKVQYGDATGFEESTETRLRAVREDLTWRISWAAKNDDSDAAARFIALQRAIDAVLAAAKWGFDAVHE